MRRTFNPLWGRSWISALLVATIFVQACSGSDAEDSPVASDPPASLESPRATSEPNGRAAKGLVKQCHWGSRKKARESAIRNSFVDRESGEVRLLLADDTVRPGEILSVAVVNDSSASVLYGTFSHVETETGQPVRIKGPYGFPAIGLSATPSNVGPCVTLPVPSATESGTYVAVIDDVRLADGEPADLRATFTVAGAAIHDPEWEVRIRQAARENRSRRQDRSDP